MKSASFARAIQAFVFGNEAPPALEGALFVALHFGPPGDDQAHNECTYPGYDRISIPRGRGWRLSGGEATNAGDVLFAVCSGPYREQATHFSIGTKARGSTVLHAGELEEPIDIKRNTRPVLPAGSLVVTEESEE